MLFWQQQTLNHMWLFLLWLVSWRHPVKDLPEAKQWFKLASMVVVMITSLPNGSELSSGRITWILQYTEDVQSKS